MDKSKLTGHLAAFSAYAIFGINIVTTKDIANCGIVSPIVLFTLRAIGACVIFWLLSLFLQKERVPLRDMWKIACASFLGLFVPQLTFLKAIGITTAIDTSILSSITPIFTMFIAAIFLKEPLSWKKVLGVILSFGGVVFLILNSITIHHGANETSPMGIVLLVLNTLSFASYLGIFRPIISRYSVVTFMKWMFLFSLLLSLPFSLKGLATTAFVAIPMKVWLEIGFLIVFATFVAYFLIPYGQQRIRPTLISMYTYVQPILAVIISICAAIDVMTWQKIVAMSVIFGGVLIVNRSRAKEK